MNEDKLSNELTGIAIALINNIKAENKRLKEENAMLLEIIRTLTKKP